MLVPVVDYAELDPATLAGLQAELQVLTTLERVLNWGRRQTPPLAVDEILTQDEYTHDVLMPGPSGIYLNFDTT